MRKRPSSIWIVTIVGLLMGPAYLYYQLWLRSYDLQSTLSSIEPVHLFFTLLTVPVALGVFSVRPWGYFTYLGYSVLLVAYFLYEYFTSPLIHNYGLLLGAVGILGSVSLLIQRHVTAPYFNPRLRWWERDPRYRVSLQADFVIDGDIRRAQILDVSLSGCYVVLDTRVSAGDPVTVELRLMDHKVRVLAKVIWANKEHPGTYGVMFTEVDRATRQDLKKVIEYLVKSSSGAAPIIDQGVPHKTATQSL